MTRLRRNWGNDYQLRDLLDAQPGSLEFATRDFALLTMAANLVELYSAELVFKGGFVLRHVYGVLRFSKDLDATRDKPPRARLEASDVARVIDGSSIGDQVQFRTGQPATDSPRSLDFDRIEVKGALLPRSHVQLEVSYREAVVDPPLRAMIGEPFYEPFLILALQTHEIGAEKMRTLAQRTRPTDLADLATVLRDSDMDDADIGRVAVEKFKIVSRGSRAERIKANIDQIGADYDATVPPLFPQAPSYAEAVDTVWPRIKSLIP